MRRGHADLQVLDRCEVEELDEGDAAHAEDREEAELSPRRAQARPPGHERDQAEPDERARAASLVSRNGEIPDSRTPTLATVPFTANSAAAAMTIT